MLIADCAPCVPPGACVVAQAILGGFFLTNLIVAVLVIHFSKTREEEALAEEEEEDGACPHARVPASGSGGSKRLVCLPCYGCGC